MLQKGKIGAADQEHRAVRRYEVELAQVEGILRGEKDDAVNQAYCRLIQSKELLVPRHFLRIMAKVCDICVGKMVAEGLPRPSLLELLPQSLCQEVPVSFFPGISPSNRLTLLLKREIRAMLET